MMLRTGPGKLLGGSQKASMVSPLVDVVFNLMITMFVFLMIYMAVVTPREDTIDLRFLRDTLPSAAARSEYKTNIPVAGGSGNYSFLFAPKIDTGDLGMASPGELTHNADLGIEPAPWLSRIPVKNSQGVPADQLHVDDSLYLTMAWDTGLIEGHIYTDDTQQVVSFGVIVLDRGSSYNAPLEKVEQWGDLYLYFYQEHVNAHERSEETETNATIANKVEENQVDADAPRVPAYYAVRGNFTVNVDPQVITFDPERTPLRILGVETIEATASFPIAERLSPIGGVEPYEFAALGVPAWLEIDRLTGELTGTSPVSGIYQFQVELKDRQTLTWTEAITRRSEIGTPYASRTITVHVKPYDPIALELVLPGYGRIGTSVTAVALATGGYGRYEFTAEELPPGLALDAATGMITGIPTETGVFDVVIDVVDESNRRAVASMTWRVIEPLPPRGIVH